MLLLSVLARQQHRGRALVGLRDDPYLTGWCVVGGEQPLVAGEGALVEAPVVAIDVSPVAPLVACQQLGE
jgi:hypothetical protein